MDRSMDDTQTTGPATDDTGIAQTPTGVDAPSGSPGFSERGRMRRRMRFLRKARELAYRDLGGLVFDLHRFGRRNDALVLAKLETIGRIDTELRALQDTLAERRPVTVLREAGVAACPRCAAIHGSDDRFCPNCGLAMDLRAERPMAGPQSAIQPPPASTPTSASAPMPAPAMTPTAAHAPAPAMPASGEAPPAAHAGGAPAPATPAPNPPATPPAPSAATPARAAPARTAPAPSPAPPAGASPAPAARTPRAPTPTAPPARAGAPSTPAAPVAPAQDATPPPGPAPAGGEDPAAGESRPNVDQPTEIVRPPSQNP
jgi:hypothetical protein